MSSETSAIYGMGHPLANPIGIGENWASRGTGFLCWRIRLSYSRTPHKLLTTKSEHFVWKTYSPTSRAQSEKGRQMWTGQLKNMDPGGEVKEHWPSKQAQEQAHEKEKGIFRELTHSCKDGIGWIKWHSGRTGGNHKNTECGSTPTTVFSCKAATASQRDNSQRWAETYRGILQEASRYWHVVQCHEIKEQSMWESWCSQRHTQAHCRLQGQHDLFEKHIWNDSISLCM